MPVTELSTWLRLQSSVGLATCTWLAARGGEVGPGSSTAIAIGVAVSFGWLVWRLRAWRTVADAVTTARLLGLVGLLAMAPAGGGWAWWLGAVAVVSADLLDGAAARRFGGSPAGALLDMEADQFVVFGLATAIVLGGGGRHVLVLPSLRWAFVLASWWLRIPAHEPKPVNGDNRRGRRICAAVMVALLIATIPGLEPTIGDAGTALAVVLLAWSFAADARHLLVRRREGASA